MSNQTSFPSRILIETTPQGSQQTKYRTARPECTAAFLTRDNLPSAEEEAPSAQKEAHPSQPSTLPRHRQYQDGMVATATQQEDTQSLPYFFRISSCLDFISALLKSKRRHHVANHEAQGAVSSCGTSFRFWWLPCCPARAQGGAGRAVQRHLLANEPSQLTL